MNKFFKKATSWLMTLQLIASWSIPANANNTIALSKADALKTMQERYIQAQKTISKSGAAAGYDVLKIGNRHGDKTLFVDSVREIGNLPNIEAISDGYSMTVGDKKVVLDFSKIEQGQFKVGGQTVYLTQESTLESVAAQVEKIQSKIQYSSINKNLLEEVISAILPQNAYAGMGWILGVVLMGLGVWMLTKNSKKKGYEQGFQDGQNQPVYGGSGGGYIYQPRHGGGLRQDGPGRSAQPDVDVDEDAISK